MLQGQKTQSVSSTHPLTLEARPQHPEHKNTKHEDTTNITNTPNTNKHKTQNTQLVSIWNPLSRGITTTTRVWYGVVCYSMMIGMIIIIIILWWHYWCLELMSPHQKSLSHRHTFPNPFYQQESCQKYKSLPPLGKNHNSAEEFNKYIQNIWQIKSTWNFIWFFSKF